MDGRSGRAGLWRWPRETFQAGATVVRRDVHRSGRVWSEQALRVITDTGEALATACAPGAQALWPALYAKARVDGDRSVRTEAFDATGEWEPAPGVWQETALLLWKPPTAWFSINAFTPRTGHAAHHGCTRGRGHPLRRVSSSGGMPCTAAWAAICPSIKDVRM
ncbi:hypothetical protein HNQ79_005418 [Streptomyces candidus]|uniref:Uncharacterized protein n=1 Tax=Streptomyces candidus TaxID=67283 RepID=A0A7X0HJP5_9ACTN|nr:hypothetical protein [Streptomyces candidus]GHH52514.1 hypothetical protein GCM10018773_52640 [Streptomyces candidus]